MSEFTTPPYQPGVATPMIQEDLSSVGEESRLGIVTLQDLEEIDDFLEVFNDEIEKLQGDKSPTLPLALLCMTLLKSHCEEQPGDSAMVRTLKERALEELDKRVSLSMDHKITTCLWPSFRDLDMLPANERDEVYATLRELCALVPMDGDEMNEESEPPPKRPKLLKGYEKWRKTASAYWQQDELARYLSQTLHVGDDSDLLQWWKENAVQFPRLPSVARKILNIPASSASSERAWSAAGNTISPQRSNLSPDCIDNLLFLNSILNNTG